MIKEKILTIIFTAQFG